MRPDLHKVQFSHTITEMSVCVAEYNCNNMVCTVPPLNKCVSPVWAPIFRSCLEITAVSSWARKVSGSVMWWHPTFQSLWTFTSVCQGGFWFLSLPLQVSPLVCSCRHPHDSPVEEKERAGSKCGRIWVSLFYSAASYLKPCSPGDYQSVLFRLLNHSETFLVDRMWECFLQCL